MVNKTQQKKYKFPIEIVLRNPKQKMYFDNEIQSLYTEIIGIGKVFEIDLSKEMLKRENVKKITLIIE